MSLCCNAKVDYFALQHFQNKPPGKVLLQCEKVIGIVENLRTRQYELLRAGLIVKSVSAPAFD